MDCEHSDSQQNTDSDNVLQEKWVCFDCGHTEVAPADELAGNVVEKVVGSGRRETTIETPVCPECESDSWHSEGVTDAFFPSQQDLLSSTTVTEQETE